LEEEIGLRFRMEMLVMIVMIICLIFMALLGIKILLFLLLLPTSMEKTIQQGNWRQPFMGLQDMI